MNDRIKHVKNKVLKKYNMTAVIVLGFLAVIAVGTVLLMLPISSRERVFTNPLTASFTSVSATCVTGLVQVDTGSYWSAFGQVVILLLIQTGGLGFMTVAIIAALMFGKSVTPRDRMLVAMSYNLNSYESVLDLLGKIIAGTVIFELAGAVALATQFVPQYGLYGLWVSLFTSVSAFCNAGFDIFGNNFGSLAAYAENPVINITIMLLIIIGGIGFLVWSDILRLIKERKPLSVYSRLVLRITVVLIVGGALLIAAFEWNNAATIGEMSVGNKIMSSLFQSVTLRTAGFSAIDNGALTQNSVLLSIILMIVGGASGSTAGGVKVVTVGVLLYTIWSVARGKREIIVFRRKINQESFTRAVAVFTVQVLFLLLGTVLIVADSGFDMLTVMFEAASAVDTVGITMGITTLLGPFSQIILMCMMFFGRVGILTIACALLNRLSRANSSMTYPDANVLIG